MGWGGWGGGKVVGGGEHPMSDVLGGGDSTVRSNASWVMVTWGTPLDRRTRVKTSNS